MTTPESWTVDGDRLKNLFSKWLHRARNNQLQHYEAAQHFSRLHQLIGIPATILSVIVGSTVFAVLQKQIGIRWQIAVSALSVLAATLSGMQTFLQFSELAEKHRSSAAAYAAVRHQLEVLITFAPPPTASSTKEHVDQLERQIDSLASTSPDVPRHIWNKVNARNKDDNYFLKS